ncbi:hypothetical protein A2U01_0082173, partial [Trifolium medium]|nr:hypothetical protein [Trifolium medium]
SVGSESVGSEVCFRVGPSEVLSIASGEDSTSGLAGSGLSSSGSGVLIT